MKNLLNYIYEGESNNVNVQVKQVNDLGGVITSKNGVVNFTKHPVYCNGDDAYEITLLIVDSAHMRNGEGTALVNAVIELANKDNKDIVVRAIPLDTLIKQKDLTDFYTKLGFKEDGDNHQMKYVCEK